MMNNRWGDDRGRGKWKKRSVKEVVLKKKKIPQPYKYIWWNRKKLLIILDLLLQGNGNAILILLVYCLFVLFYGFALFWNLFFFYKLIFFFHVISKKVMKKLILCHILSPLIFFLFSAKTLLLHPLLLQYKLQFLVGKSLFQVSHPPQSINLCGQISRFSLFCFWYIYIYWTYSVRLKIYNLVLVINLLSYS